MTDMVNHPEHYNAHPAGIECIDVIEPMPFNVGSSMKYLWRAGLKGDALEDLMKAHWYVVREIGRLQRGKVEETLMARLQEHLGFEAVRAEAPAEAAIPEVDVRAAEATAEQQPEDRRGKSKRW